MFATWDILNLLIGVLGAAALFYSAVTKFTTLSALTQMGSIQERGASWTDWTKPIVKSVSDSATSSGDADTKKGAADNMPRSSEEGPGSPQTVLSPSLQASSSSPTGDSATGAANKLFDSVRKAGSTVTSTVADSFLHDVQIQDQVVYTASVVNMLLTAYIAGAAPQYFYLWHTPKAIAYITHRWWTFRSQGQHYLLFDLCYWVNALSLVYIWVFPNSEILFQVIFELCNGPLAWSVLAFSQSLIFHSAPHMASVFIHVSPMILTYCIRWDATSQKTFAVCADFPACTSVSAAALLWNAMTKMYLVWLVLYYVFIYIVMDARIRERGYKTLFDRIITRGPTKNIAKLHPNEMVQKSIYMITHCAFAFATMLLATIYFTSRVAHFVFMFCIIAASSWNASGFFFTAFVQQQHAELVKREVAAAAAAAAASNTAAATGATVAPSEGKKQQ